PRPFAPRPRPAALPCAGPALDRRRSWLVGASSGLGRRMELGQPHGERPLAGAELRAGELEAVDRDGERPVLGRAERDDVAVLEVEQLAEGDLDLAQARGEDDLD